MKIFNRSFRFFFIAIILVLTRTSSPANPNMHQPYFLQISEIEKVKTALSDPDRELLKYINVMQIASDSIMHMRPLSVTNHRCPVGEIDPHEYYSESTYWWPNPENPKAPFVRKDGIPNPNRFLKHKDDLNTLCQSILLLSVTAYLFDSPKYAEKAKELVKVWFIDPHTRMNPDAKYAQVIPNSFRQRGVGILDTRRFVFLIEGIQLLKRIGYWDHELDIELQKWFSDYLDWLLNSYYGKDERFRGNNHSTWYAVQVVTYARYTGNQKVISGTWDYVRNILLEKQITADGKMPLEMSRTRSLSYFIFNLEAWSLLARLAEADGINLWELENSKGGSLSKSVNFIFPYIDNTKKWEQTQITTFNKREYIFLLYAGKALKNRKLVNLYQSVMTPKIIQKENLLFVMNMVQNVI